jgi:hypothetical protein
MFYACIEKKDGKVIRKPFEKREDARLYINIHFNSKTDKACWTE